MSSVIWEQLESGKFEDMVAVLLSILHPLAERIDGRGGDGGRDVQIPSAAGPDVFELKSFTGRLGQEGGRRRQVASSLERAKELKPKSWTLVVPIDSTPDERAWFDNLKRTVNFPLVWSGKTWLDARMAQHPYVPKYFLWGGADEAIVILKELKEEEAALSRGVPDVLERMRKLATRLDQLDPYYTFSVVIEGEATRVEVRPRFLGAEKERPILVNFQGKFPRTEEGRAALSEFQQAIDYGTRATLPPEFVKALHIDAPAGMGGTFENIQIEISGAVDSSWRMQARFSAIDPNGSQIASLPVVFDKRQVGLRGGTIYGRDHTGALTFELQLDVAVKAGGGGPPLHFNFLTPADIIPGTILPVLQLLRAMQAPNFAELEVNGKPTLKMFPGPKQTVPDHYIELIQALHRVQVATGTYFAIPDRFSPEDLAHIARADTLLKGDPVQFDWTHMTVGVAGENLDPLDELATAGRADLFQMGMDYSLSIAGHEVPLGRAVLTLRSIRVENQAEIFAMLPVAADTLVRFKLLSEAGEKGEIALG